MKIGFQGEPRFPQPHVYLAIYAHTSSFKDTLMYSFGDHAEQVIDQRFRLKSEGAAANTQAEEKRKEAKTFNTKQKLIKFQKDTEKQVGLLMLDKDMMKDFQSKLTNIKDEKQASSKVRHGSLA